MTKTQFRTALSQLGLTQGRAAEVLDVTLRTISNWANGHWPIPRVVELAILSKTMNEANALFAILARLKYWATERDEDIKLIARSALRNAGYSDSEIDENVSRQLVD